MPPLVVKNLDSLKDLVGREIAITDWLPVTQDRIQQFAEATEDRQWIHLDRNRAQRDSPYGTTIAHGFLTLSLLSHLSKQALQIQDGVRLAVNYGLNRVRFTAPVRAGTTIRARFTLQSFKDVGGAREIVFSVVVEAEDVDGQKSESRKPCCVAEWVVRYYP
jgi:acyl dehydratase